MPSTPSSATPEARRGPLVAVAAGAVALVAVVLVSVLVVSSRRDDRVDSRSATAGTVRPTVGSGPAEIGAPAPDFVLPGLNGGQVALGDRAGQPVVVNFWASWCNPCRKEFPLLRAAQARHARDDIEIIGVSYRDIAADGRRFVRDRGATWAFARDPDGKLAMAYGVRAVPQTFFIDSRGTVVSRVFGITSAEDLEAEIRKILPAR